MLKNGIIEESQSNWSSPYILVRKHDGGFRFCTDFRKVNGKTKSDSFAFVTPSGLYQNKVMPFGMKTFQRMVNKLVREIDGCETYIQMMWSSIVINGQITSVRLNVSFK